MYYSFNNEKKPVKARVLPDSVLGIYIKPQLIGRKVMVKSYQNSPTKYKSTNRTVCKPSEKDTPYKKAISRLSLNNSGLDDMGEGNSHIAIIPNSYATIDYSTNYSPKINSITTLTTSREILPVIHSYKDSKKLDTIERDYIKTEEPLIAKYKLHKTGLKQAYSSMMRNSLNSLTISKFNRYCDGYSGCLSTPLAKSNL
jgi:hypothetical protein